MGHERAGTLSAFSGAIGARRPAVTGVSPADATFTRRGANQLPSRDVCTREAAAPSPAGKRRRGIVTRSVGVAVLALALTSCGGGSGSPSASGTVSTELAKAVHEELSGHKAQAVVDFLAVVKADPH